MNKLFKLAAMCVAAVVSESVALAGGNEPDTYVEWVGFASQKNGPYINTGYVFTRMPLVEVGVASLSCGDSDFLGTDTATTGCLIIDITSNGAGYFYRYGSSGASFTSVGSGPYSLNTTTFNDVVWGRDIYYNGTRVGYGNNVTDDTFKNNTKPCYLFKGRNLFNGTAKVSYLRMYNGTNRTELVRDFRPGVKDGNVGFYDAVEDSFYANNGTGSFDCGPRVAETNAVFVDTNWLKFGEPDVTYGATRGLAAGEARVFTAPSGNVEFEGYQATCIGWKLYKFDPATREFLTEPYQTGDGATCEYEHPDPAEFVRLEWIWQADASQAETMKAGEWDDPEVWSSKQVPTKETHAIVSHNVHCSGDVLAKSITVRDGVILRFHASTAYSVAQATPDAPGEGSFTFDVTEDVKLKGGSLALHGGRENSTITNLNLTIGGDLILEGAAKMCVAAAAYDGADCSLTNLYNTATRLRIGGALTLADTAVLYTVCDQKVGSPVRIDCASFTLGASAKVLADERGWNWLAGTADSRRPFKTLERNRYTFAYGPGHDQSRTGGGYGGGGSNDGTVTAPGFGATYGYAYAPFLPGSPSGGDGNYGLDYGRTQGACRGGGVFWLVTPGTATLNGTISATVPQVGWQAASGGSVWIAAKDFVVGENAKVDVSGGDAGSSTPTAAGGGGRISFAKDVPEADLAALARGERPDGYLYNDEQTLVTVDIAGGRSTATDVAQPGTATFVTPAAALHFVTFDGNPVQAGTVTPKYGAHPLEEGAVQSFSADLYGIDPANATWRHLCLGYVVSNVTGQIGGQPTIRGELTVGTTDMSVTWLWDETEYLTYLNLTGPGRLSLLGESYGTATNVYLKASTANVLTAVPNDGCEFLYWLGEVSAEERINPVLTLDASRQQHVTAVFRVAGGAGTCVWKEGTDGDFTDAANWEGGFVPGIGDAVVVASGTCRIPEFVQCAALTVSGNGKVVTVRQKKIDGYDTSELKVTGNVRLEDTAVLQLGATDGSSTVYNTLDVGGSLVLEDSATLEVAAGRRTGAYTWATGCGFVRVGGDFRLKDSSVFKPNCDGYYGGGVMTTVGGAFAVAEAARVDADGRGMGTYSNLGWNVGVGTSGTAAPSHFGKGADATNGRQGPWSGAVTYDNAWTPLNPGQQNRESGSAVLCRGGGVVRIFAGRIHIDGTVTANGISCAGGNSSGGTIWLVSRNLAAFGESAVLTAQGAYSESWPGMGAAGGGCVAIYSYFTPEMVEWVMAHSNSPLGPYADDDRPPKRIREWTDDLLVLHPSFADAAAPGTPARTSESCWGSFRALRGPAGGFLMMVR